MTACNTQSIVASDGYRLHVRCWQASNAIAQIVITHGVVSHSLWLEPIARQLADNGITCICPDRRGAGQNTQHRGDAISEEVLLDDLHQVIKQLTTPQLMTHIAGFCWGSNYLINYAARYKPDVASICLLAPALFPAENLREAELTINSSGEATETPIVPIDGFTRGPQYHDFILPDPLRLHFVSPRFNGIMQNFSRMIGIKLMKLGLPTLIVLASDDRMTDNPTTARVFERLSVEPKAICYVPGEHGIQFDAPNESSVAITHWIQQFTSAA